MNLTPEQLAYLKSLESPKKRRKFMLDCLVENTLGESDGFFLAKPITLSKEEFQQIVDSNPELKEWLGADYDSTKEKFESVMNQTSTAPATLKGLLNFCGVSDEQMSKSVFRKSSNPNYSPEEIEIAKSLNSEREEKKWTDNDMICAFEKGNHATCNAFTLREKPSKEQSNLYIELKDEFIKSLKNK